MIRIRTLFRDGREDSGESGLASLFVIGLSLAVFLSAGLAMDGSRVLGSTRECSLVAGSAARIAAQQYAGDPTGSGEVVLDVGAAKAAAEAALIEQGFTTFRVEVTPTTVRVGVWKDIPMILLVGWAHTRVNGSATTQLRSGIEG